jgi:Kef-type K+ transport system membrane component KefB
MDAGIIVGLLGVVIVAGVIIFWIATLVDILKHDFNSPINKVIWIILVILLPLLGVILYYIVGKGQRIIKKEIGDDAQYGSTET